jgi:hypothetical protein
MVWRLAGDQLAALTFFRDPDEAELAARGQSES